MNGELSKAIYESAIRCGFNNCGIISVEGAAGFEELLQKRISNIPRSKYFYEHVGGFEGIKERFPWAKSIVILTYHYGKHCYPKEMQGKYGKAFFLEPEESSHQGYDSRGFEQWLTEHGIHAEGGNQFHASSIGPLRYIAEKAGLGIIRKNNFFYTEQGSYQALAGYVIDKECELIQATKLVPCSDTCDLCQRACKTKALQSAYTMDPFKCVSYLTTFGNSDIPEELSPEMFEEWVCGCDNCQDACPHNRRHDWNGGENFSNLKELAPIIAPGNYDNLSDEFLIEQVIPKTANHLQSTDVQALRKNAERAFKYQQTKWEHAAIKQAQYHLPGLFEFYELYKVFLPLFYKHREYFYDWCKIGSIYGAPSDCLWGGGRVGFGENDTREVLALMKKYHISARLTLSNSQLQKEHLSDKQCNDLCALFQENENGENGVIIHSDLLLNYLKEQYPGLYLISSTTKVITDFEKFTEELNREEFRYVVPDFRLNHKMQQLEQLSAGQKEKVEFLCNECCFFGCGDRKECYENVSHKVLGHDYPDHICSAPDAKEGYVFSKAMKNPGFIGIEEIQNLYLPMGFSNFKIEGRSLGSALILEFLLYYMTKPEYQLQVREKIYLDHSLWLF